MFMCEPLPFVKKYIETIDEGLTKYDPKYKLSNIQKYWLCFCIMGTLLTNTVCWAKFERMSLGVYCVGALSWMFRNCGIKWEYLLLISTKIILTRYGITEACISVDDSQRRRSKSTKRISKVYKQKDKGTGGYIMGQNIVFLLLITPLISFPVGFAFHMPDPEFKKWKENDAKLRKQGIPKSKRPRQPERKSEYPTIPELGYKLIEKFKLNHKNIKIKCIFADALYGTKEFMDKTSDLYGGIQVISQIRSNQKIHHGNEKAISVEKYFSDCPKTNQKLNLRGGKEVNVTFCFAQIFVKSHGKKRFVLALKYENEKEFRYIVATALSWQPINILETYTLRWLIEVFFEDWKGYEGWNKLAKQPDEKGSSRGLILSLLVDHCLFFHPTQTALIKDKLSACTVGSLVARIGGESLIGTIQTIVDSENPKEKLNDLIKLLEDDIIPIKYSSKHMVNKDISVFRTHNDWEDRKVA